MIPSFFMISSSGFIFLEDPVPFLYEKLLQELNGKLINRNSFMYSIYSMSLYSFTTGLVMSC